MKVKVRMIPLEDSGPIIFESVSPVKVKVRVASPSTIPAAKPKSSSKISVIVRTRKTSRFESIVLDDKRKTYRDAITWYTRSGVVFARVPVIPLGTLKTDDHVCVDVAVSVMRDGAGRIDQRDAIKILDALADVLPTLGDRLNEALI